MSVFYALQIVKMVPSRAKGLKYKQSSKHELRKNKNDTPYAILV